MLGDPAGEALAETAAEELEIHLLVRPDRPLERDRDDVVRQLHEIHAGVVVVDDPARLLDDRSADLADRRRPAEPGRRGLEHAELGGSRFGLFEQLGVGQRDGRVRGQGRDERDVAARPLARLAGDGRQGTDHPVVVDERGDQVAGELDDAVVACIAVAEVAADIGEREHPPGPQDLADPALVAMEGREARRDVVRQPGPGGDLEAIVLEDPDRRHVGAQGPLRLVDDHAEQLGSVMRAGQSLGDAEDGVESLRELRLEGGRHVVAGTPAEVGLRRHRSGRRGQRLAPALSVRAHPAAGPMPRRAAASRPTARRCRSVPADRSGQRPSARTSRARVHGAALERSWTDARIRERGNIPTLRTGAPARKSHPSAGDPRSVGVAGAPRGGRDDIARRAAGLVPVTGRGPGIEPVRDPGHIGEPGRSQDRRSDGRAVAGRTGGDDRPVAGQRVKAIGQRPRPDVDRTGNVPGVVLGRLADVDDERAGPCLPLRPATARGRRPR